MSKFILIKEFDTVYSHFPDVTGNYTSLCGLDGDDLAQDVRQEVIGEAKTVTCPQCIAIFDVIQMYREIDITRAKVNVIDPRPVRDIIT